MSRIIFQKSYITILPSFKKADTHKHPLLHMFFGKDNCKIMVNDTVVEGPVLLLNSNVKHTAKAGNGCTFFLLIDPTSVIAEQLLNQYLQKRAYMVFPSPRVPIPDNLSELPDETIISIIQDIFSTLGITSNQWNPMEKRIEQVIEHIISGEWLDYSIREIAKEVYLSESRLTHLFKEEAGISLKSYLLIRKMERSYKFAVSGGKITRAAQEGGFASSAHLAYTCKKLTGVSITDVLKIHET